MLAHIDVVEAKREDWTRDPFTLIEEDGYFYGRGRWSQFAWAASRFQLPHGSARTIGRCMLSWPSCEKTNVISDWSAQ
jgi:hypothetical protein